MYINSRFMSCLKERYMILQGPDAVLLMLKYLEKKLTGRRIRSILYTVLIYSFSFSAMSDQSKWTQQLIGCILSELPSWWGGVRSGWSWWCGRRVWRRRGRTTRPSGSGPAPCPAVTPANTGLGLSARCGQLIFKKLSGVFDSAESDSAVSLTTRGVKLSGVIDSTEIYYDTKSELFFITDV